MHVFFVLVLNFEFLFYFIIMKKDQRIFNKVVGVIKGRVGTLEKYGQN
jgi:hypothetical protein